MMNDTQVLYNKLMRLIEAGGYDVPTKLAALTLCEHEIMEGFKDFVIEFWGGDPHHVDEETSDELDEGLGDGPSCQVGD